mgnify:CR=1 FL=1|tara:strand:- start:798 stop:1010 length:213 start_codon:yes stop_codon:yes gene_type:complete
MEDITSKKWMIEMLNEELSSNLRILIDPKRKDSFSQSRIQTWKELVSERIYHHLTNQNKYQNKYLDKHEK